MLLRYYLLDTCTCICNLSIGSQGLHNFLLFFFFLESEFCEHFFNILRGMKSVLSVLLSVAIFYRKFCSADFNPAYVCSGCILISDLIEESAQYQVVDYFYKQCSLTKTPALCTTATKLFLKQLLEKVQPEVICGRISACSKGCPLFSEWPIKNIPDAQPDWPTERRQLLEAINPDSNLVPLLEVFQNIIGDANENDSFLSFFGHMAYAIAEVKSVTIEGGCGHNLTCKALELADQHLPFVDHDGDKFAPAEAKRLRYAYMIHPHIYFC